MMNMYYKWKGKNALRGNWQTAMVVAFFSGIFLVLTQVYQNRFMPVAIEMIDGMYYWRVPQITRGVWIGFAVPAKTPDAVAKRLVAALQKVTRTPEFKVFVDKTTFSEILFVSESIVSI